MTQEERDEIVQLVYKTSVGSPQQCQRIVDLVRIHVNANTTFCTSCGSSMQLAVRMLKEWYETN
jgi:hypothetical protein